MSLFEAIYSPSPGLKPEDRTKAQALVTVVAKSTASLDDAVKLADALGLILQISAASKPTSPPEEKP